MCFIRLLQTCSLNSFNKHPVWAKETSSRAKKFKHATSIPLFYLLLGSFTFFLFSRSDCPIRSPNHSIRRFIRPSAPQTCYSWRVYCLTTCIQDCSICQIVGRYLWLKVLVEKMRCRNGNQNRNSTHEMIILMWTLWFAGVKDAGGHARYLCNFSLR